MFWLGGLFVSRESKLVKNTLILSLGNVLPKICNFITLPILTGYLTKSEYGTYDLIVILCYLFLPIITLQIQTSGFRFLIDERYNEENKCSVITNIIIFIVPVSLLSLFILFFCMYKYSIAIRLLIIVYLFFDTTYITMGQVARGLSDNKAYSFAAFINSLLNMLMIIVLVYYFRCGLEGVLVCSIFSVAIPSIFLIIKTQLYKCIKISSINLKLLKEMLNYSLPMVPNTLSMWIMNASDRLMVYRYLGIESNAVYAVSKKIPNMLTFAQGTFTMAWQESASLAADSDDAEVYYTKMFDVVFFIMSGAVLIISAMMPMLFSLLVRGSYDEAYYQMPILLLGMFFYSISAYLGGLYVAAKKTKSVGVTTTIAAFINLLTCFIFIKYIGLFAASLSTLISHMFLTIYRMINIKKYISISYNKTKILVGIIIILFVLIISYIKNIYFYFLLAAIAIVYNFYFNKVIIFGVFNKIRLLKNNK